MRVWVWVRVRVWVWVWVRVWVRMRARTAAAAASTTSGAHRCNVAARGAAGPKQRVRESTVVRREQQALTVRVEPTDGRDTDGTPAAHGCSKQVAHRWQRSALSAALGGGVGGHGGDVALRLVEGDVLARRRRREQLPIQPQRADGSSRVEHLRVAVSHAATH